VDENASPKGGVKGVQPTSSSKLNRSSTGEGLLLLLALALFFAVCVVVARRRFSAEKRRATFFVVVEATSDAIDGKPQAFLGQDFHQLTCGGSIATTALLK
jgi:hypothetical protein